jgi:hypothetical protein
LKILLISGAYKNAGDYLIAQRGENLLRHLKPGCTVDRHMANVPFGDRLAEINRYDWIVFAGGPGYQKEYYPKIAPLCPNLDILTPRIMILGMGSALRDPSPNALKRYRFKNRGLWDRVQRDAGYLGCRDDVTVRLMQRNGYASALMVGCPAWYDLPHVDQLQLDDGCGIPFRKICISDPGQICANEAACLGLISLIRSRYPEASVEFLFHRGIDKDAYTSEAVAEANHRVKRELERLHVPYYDISYGHEGFAHYDDADLHIGFRVHAHIYTLSKRRPSILIEEDGRGTGVNETFRLPHVPAYSPQRQWDWKQAFGSARHLKPYRPALKRNPNVLAETAAALDRLEADQSAYFSSAFERMVQAFQMMQKQIIQVR